MSLNKTSFETESKEDGYKKESTVNKGMVTTMLGAWLLQLIIGAQVALGNYQVYFTSYYRYTLGYSTVETSQFYPMFTIILGTSSLCYPFGNKLVDYFENNSKPVILTGAFVAMTAVLCCSLFEFPPTVFVVVYSIGMGTLKGLMQPAIWRAGLTQLPKKQGLMSAFIISGYGFGGFGFGLLINHLFNPNNVKFQYEDGCTDPTTCKKFLPKEVGDNFPYALMTLFVIYTTLIIIGTTLIKNKPVDQQEEDTYALNNDNDEVEEGKDSIIPYVTSKRFIHIYIMVLMYLFYGFFFGTTYKVIGKDTINDDQFLSIIGAVSLLTSGLCKFGFAVSLDYIEFKKSFAVVSFIYLGCILFMKTAVQYKSSYFFIVVLSYCCDGAISSMMPVLIFKTFGNINGARVYSYLYSVYFASTLSFMFAMSFQGSSENYDNLIYISVVTTVIAIILNLTLNNEPFKLEASSK